MEKTKEKFYFEMGVVAAIITGLGAGCIGVGVIAELHALFPAIFKYPVYENLLPAGIAFATAGYLLARWVDKKRAKASSSQEVSGVIP